MTGPILHHALQASQSVNAIAAMVGLFVLCGTVPIDFTELLRRAARGFASQQAFAKALGMSTPRLNRALNKSDYPFNVLNCLRLAKLSGESASEILRAANKVEVAELIELLYGQPDVSTTPDERELFEHIRRMKPSARNKLLGFIGEVQPASKEKNPRRKSA